MAGLRKSVGAAAAIGLGVLTPVLLAGPASAHTHQWEVTCDKVTVDLALYDDEATNTVSLQVGTEKVLDKQPFSGSLHKSFPVPAHTADLTATLSVVSSQDLNGGKKWTFTETKTIKPCPAPSHSPSPSPTPTGSATPSPSASVSSPAPSKTTAKPAPSPTGPQLASTGGGSNTGMIAAAGVGVIVIGGAVLLLTRRRSGRD